MSEMSRRKARSAFATVIQSKTFRPDSPGPGSDDWSHLAAASLPGSARPTARKLVTGRVSTRPDARHRREWCARLPNAIGQHWKTNEGVKRT